MNDKFLKPYNPKATEASIYKMWEKTGFFNPDNCQNKRGEVFSILMPPTNANGSLHAGHGLVMTIQDIIDETIAKVGENIKVGRFARFEVGE